jgi:uncharacterized protein YeaO (DUF488 family)
MTSISRLLPVLGAVLLLCAAATDSQVLYKYTGQDGKIVYSDSPPPKGVAFEKILVDTSKTGVNPLQRDNVGSSSQVQDFEARYRERKVKEAEHDQLIAGLQQNYDAAVAALESAKEPQEGERTQNVNGTSRLNENYFNRLTELQKNVDEARAKLDAARQQ